MHQPLPAGHKLRWGLPFFHDLLSFSVLLPSVQLQMEIHRACVLLGHMFGLADVPILFEVISLVSMASTDLECHGVAVMASLVKWSAVAWILAGDWPPLIKHRP